MIRRFSVNDNCICFPYPALWLLQFLALLFLILGMGSILGHSQSLPNQSKLLIFVCVKKGKLAVDRTKTQMALNHFEPSDESKARLSKRLTEEKLLQQLFDDLDEAFGQMNFIYRYALQGEEQDKDPNDKLTQELRAFTGGSDCWEAFKGKYAEWVQVGASAGKTRTEMKVLFTGGEMLSKLDTSSTPLLFATSTRPRPWNDEQGSLRFRVADPIGSLDEITIDFSGNLSDDPETKKKREEIKSLLGSLQGQLWRHKDIKSRIEDYYGERGLMAQATISPAVAQPRSIVISESPRLSQVFFPFKLPLDAASVAKIEKLAYLLFSDPEFRVFIKDPAAHLADATIKGKDENGNDIVLKNRVMTDYNRLGRQPGEEPYLNQFDFQIMQMQLSQLGFQAAQQPRTTDEVRYVDLELVATEDDGSGQKKAPNNAPPPVAPTANPEGVLQAGAGRPLERNAFTAPISSRPSAVTLSDTTADSNLSPDDAQKTLESWQPKDKKNYLGFGFEYSPGQNVRAFGIYQRTLPGQSSISFKLGGQEGLLGQVSYSADYVLFHQLRRRLSIQLTGGSDVQANRIFAGTDTDERRTGALARAELELFRDLRGSLLRLSIEGNRNTVTLSRDGQIVNKLNLTTLDVGGFFIFERNEAQYPKRLRLEPRWRTGLGLAKTEPSFSSFLMTGNYHQHLPRLFETDISGHLEVASQNTPLVELPSFGGADMMRGFRRDDAIGRRVWSLQSELWMPVPGGSRASEGIARFLRRQVRLAGFADVGGAYQTTDSRAGTRFSPGLGARVIFFPVVIKLDWAYGIGDSAVGRGRGRFYFSVGTNLPF